MIFWFDMRAFLDDGPPPSSCSLDNSELYFDSGGKEGERARGFLSFHLPSVLRVAHEELGCPVPPCRHVVRVSLSCKGEKTNLRKLAHFCSITLTRRGHQPSEPEITELDDAELRDEDVLGLDVAVDYLKVTPCIHDRCDLDSFSPPLPRSFLSISHVTCRLGGRPISLYRSRQSSQTSDYWRACPHYAQGLKYARKPYFTHVVHVAELDAPEDLEDVVAGRVDVQPLGVVLELLEHGVVDVLKDQEQLSPSPKHLYQVDEVLMAQSLQCRNIQCSAWFLFCC